MQNANGKESEIEERIKDISGYECLSFDHVHNCKWYNHLKYMDAVSKEFPDVTLFLEGEEQGDVWKAIFKNGKSKVVKPEVVWPELKLD